MPEITFDVYCGTCGAGLCYNTSVKGTTVTVDACEDCMTTKYDEGYEDGIETADSGNE